ncbi:mRNA capping enzyme beta chain [Babesia microti strain RI]|uniref:mRNA 5'-phosphatase n=1 Tax=Babesia microti (strain RI) TaxID=1133968 RepID=I7IG30_BABMR|nr:mRNA capping enzyme beta chain [Babesia microti strain RI]CCF73301.1 mRNA capping enzyme beta chain [Babesia microti strain RI]|eukprot:XP_012647910.1 mRNA capping enzyme beta chain [Babesia microti strain RI]
MEVKETVTGESTVTADGIVLALVEQLELLTLSQPLSEILSGKTIDRNIEVEARIGILKERDDKRFMLPTDGDAILAKRAQVSFTPGVSTTQLKLLSDMLKSDKQWAFKGVTQTIDRYFKLAHYEDQVRWSKSPNLETLDCITKSKLVTMDVTTGKVFYQEIYDNVGDMNDYLLLDYRIAINLETTVKTSELPNENMAVYQRYRTRESFYHNKTKITIDLTKVTSKAINKSVSNITDNCEVEVELNSKKLLNLLKADSAEHVVAKRRKLIQYCATLINTARSLCTLLSLDTNVCLNKKKLKIKLCDLRVGRHDSEVERYKKFVNQQEPLIGDYLYRALASPDADQIIPNTSFYDDPKQEIDGPFYAKIDDAGKKIVASG